MVVADIGVVVVVVDFLAMVVIAFVVIVAVSL